MSLTSQHIRARTPNLHHAKLSPQPTRLPQQAPATHASPTAAAVDVSHAGCSRSLVILAMANEAALNHTVPVFLASLSRVQLAGGKHKGQALDSKLVLVAWSEGALAACRALQRRGQQGQGQGQQGYMHQCVQDREHRAATGSFGFHDEGFNALG